MIERVRLYKEILAIAMIEEKRRLHVPCPYLKIIVACNAIDQTIAQLIVGKRHCRVLIPVAMSSKLSLAI